MAARDQRGRDLLKKIARQDGDFARCFDRLRQQGLTQLWERVRADAHDDADLRLMFVAEVERHWVGLRRPHRGWIINLQLQPGHAESFKSRRPSRLRFVGIDGKPIRPASRR